MSDEKSNKKEKPKPPPPNNSLSAKVEAGYAGGKKGKKRGN